jgi:hypothetical protein
MNENQTNNEPLDTHLIFEWEPVEFSITEDGIPMPFWQFKDLTDYYCTVKMAEYLDNIEWRASYGYDIYSQNTTLRPDTNTEDS